MADNSSKDAGVDFLIKLLETQGVACSTVKDGHILMFKASYLRALLEKYAGKEELCIFIKRPDFKD